MLASILGGLGLNHQGIVVRDGRAAASAAAAGPYHATHGAAATWSRR
jgi:hypothetical protein